MNTALGFERLLVGCKDKLVFFLQMLQNSKSLGRFSTSYCVLLSIIQSINVKFVGRRCATRPGAPTVVIRKHDQKAHS